MAEKKRVELKGQQVLQAYRTEQAKLQDIQRRGQALRQLMAETLGTEQGLKEIGKSGKNQKIMVSLGSGIYFEARIESNKDVKTGLGEGVLINTTVEKALKDLARRKEEIQKDIDAARQDETLALQNLNNLGAAIESARRRAEVKEE